MNACLGILLALCLGVVSCTRSPQEDRVDRDTAAVVAGPPAPVKGGLIPTGGFHFDRFKKQCVNGHGQVGLNVGFVGQCGDLRKIDLSGRDLSQTDFKGADFSESSLRSANLNGADLREANLWSSDWSGATFSGALFSEGTKLPFDAAEAASLSLTKLTYPELDASFIAAVLALDSAQPVSQDVKNWIALGADLNQQSSLPLISGIQRSYYDLCDVLLTAGADPNTVVQNTPLLNKVVLALSPSFTELFLRHGANPNVPLRPALVDAVVNSRTEHLDVLVKYGADVHLKVDGFSLANLAHDLSTLQSIVKLGADPKAVAIWAKSDCDLLQFLLQKGADANALGPGGVTALMNSVTSTVCLDDLLPYHPRLEAEDSSGRTALTYTLNGKSSDGLSWLLAHHADPNHRFAHGTTYLMQRAQGWPFAVSRLIQAGALINAKDDKGWTALDHLILDTPPQAGFESFLDQFVLYGADINSIDGNGSPLLTRLVQNDKFANFQKLVALKPNLDLGDADGSTALMYALRSASTKDYMAPLVQAGANVNARNKKGESALMWCRSFSCASVLLKAGADVNARDATGKTPLLAVLRSPDAIDALPYNQPETDTIQLIRLLVQSGADVNAVDNQGWGALFYISHWTQFPAPNSGGRVTSPLYRLSYEIPLTKTLAALKIDFKIRDSAGKGVLNHLMEALQPKDLDALNDFYREDNNSQSIYAQMTTAQVAYLIQQGAEVNLKPAGAKSLLDLAYGLKFTVLAQQLRAAGVNETVFQPDSAFQSTPNGACDSWDSAKGFHPDAGGCVSPQGVVWSLPSPQPVDFSGSYPGEINFVSLQEYCRALRQGGRANWVLPSFTDLARDYLNGGWKNTTLSVLPTGESYYTVFVVYDFSKGIFEIYGSWKKTAITVMCVAAH